MHSSYETGPKEQTHTEGGDSDVSKNNFEVGQAHTRAAAALGEIGVHEAVILVGDGTRAESWHIRSENSQHAVPASHIHVGGEALEGTIGADGHQYGYVVDSVPIAMPLPNSEDAPRHLLIGDMNPAEKELFGISNNDTSVDFQSLGSDVKYSLLASRTYDIEATSRDANERSLAVQKNLERLSEGVVVKPGDYLHGLNINGLRKKLVTGITAGELGRDVAGQQPQLDRYPYNLDVWDATTIDAIGPNGELKTNKALQSYGDIIAVIDRSEGNTDVGNEVAFEGEDKGLQDGHKLIFGGVPATEVRALHMQANTESDPVMQKVLGEHRQAQLQEVKNTLLLEGFYIPVYDGDGNLALAPDEYAAMRQSGKLFELQRSQVDRGLRVEVPIPDFGAF